MELMVDNCYVKTMSSCVCVCVWTHTYPIIPKRCSHTVCFPRLTHPPAHINIAQPLSSPLSRREAVAKRRDSPHFDAKSRQLCVQAAIRLAFYFFWGGNKSISSGRGGGGDTVTFARCRKRLNAAKQRTREAEWRAGCRLGRSAHIHTFRLDLSAPLAAEWFQPAAISSSANSFRLPSCRRTV